MTEKTDIFVRGVQDAMDNILRTREVAITDE